MRRLAVLGFTLLLIAGCGGGGGNGVEAVMTTEPPEPADEFTLSTTGEVRDIPIDSTRASSTAEFFKWGVWGGVLRDDHVTCAAIGCPPAGERTFWAYLTSETDGRVTTTVHGTRSGTSPVSGSAVWSGDVHAYATQDAMSPDGATITVYEPVEGDAWLEVDFTAVTVDVHFTNFDNSRSVMSWDGLAMNSGEFGGGAEGIDGSFYGADHEGAAGTFERDGLTGVFGALRSSN